MELETLIKALARPTTPSSDFDLNPGTALNPGRPLRAAAVLVAIQNQPDGARIVLTKRSSHLKHHPGQIAFPGGKQDPTDSTLEAAALREAREEIGLHPGLVRILGQLPPHETVTGFLVTPFLAHISDGFDPVPEPGEVDEIFSVPLSFLMNTGNYRVEKRLWRGEWRRYFAIPYGPYYTWGATARILRGLADRVSA